VSVVFIVVPLAALIVLAAVIAFVVSARRGQFDDLDTPPVRMLNDEAVGGALRARPGMGKRDLGTVPRRDERDSSLRSE
jgi:cbb3-type cytochrome oxidase maturation protein